MEIEINQKKLFIRYQIFTDGQQTHTASRKLFSFLSVVNLFETSDDKPKMIIKKRFSWIIPKYDIKRWDNIVLEFRSKSRFKPDFECLCSNDIYNIYGHKGRKYSIFKNNSQIAWWDQDAVSLFQGFNYKIISNKDCDIDLLISFCLIIDDRKHGPHTDGATFDFGNIGPETKKFDESWQPKY